MRISDWSSDVCSSDPKHPDRIQLYSLNTPNGVKASIMLEETGLPYEAHLVDIMENESHLPEFLALNPNGKIPAIIDPGGPGGQPLGLFESGASSDESRVGNECVRTSSSRWPP